jgi:DNA-binding response OmpR family regulator
MDTAVVITSASPRESPAVEALRQDSWEVLVRRPGADVASVPRDRPDVVVVDVPGGADPRAALAAVLALPLRADVAVLAVVDAGQARRAARVEGLTDFVIRPLRPEELCARAGRGLFDTARDDDHRVRVGELVLDLKGYEVLVRGEAVDLTYQEFELLKFLACHPGEAFSRSQLLARVWGYDYYGGSRTVDIHVRRIRAKLRNPYADCLQTIRHVGYKWTRAPALGAKPQETRPR